MTTLNFICGAFDQDNTFTFAYQGRGRQECTATGYLRDYGDEGVFIMQQAACIKDQYTAKDDEERSRLNAMTPVRDGDIVEVEGKQYKVKILGNYSDAGRLIPLS